MQHATADTVLGNFSDLKLEFKGSINRFFKRNNQFLANIQGPDGQWHDYQIKYTFGVTPLQQYMVEFEDGRVQLIPFAWDSRPESQGGQRWFHLYPNMTPKDEFYWTNTGQNWNFMCADCHSTNLEKNYSADTTLIKQRGLKSVSAARHAMAQGKLTLNGSTQVNHQKRTLASTVIYQKR
ncbi:hypothetical protein [Vibrio sp. SCSIO 43186]|uniref:hypothetical protein n=1 Tax=Vibrio sp. SCSIO 43186 TaxID=2822843 RepID=UPI002075FA8E|nr:hypothetical protein [Vibrio sp. SCSIO 43186]